MGIDKLPYDGVQLPDVERVAKRYNLDEKMVKEQREEFLTIGKPPTRIVEETRGALRKGERTGIGLTAEKMKPFIEQHKRSLAVPIATIKVKR